MTSREPSGLPARLDFAGAALLTFSSVRLGALLLRSEGPHANVGVSLAQAGLLAGCLAAACAWRGGSRARQRMQRSAVACGLLFAAASAGAVLFARPVNMTPLPDPLAATLLAGLCALAGVSLGAILRSNAAWGGRLAAAYVVAAAAGLGAVRSLDAPSPAMAALTVGGAAASGALLLCWTRSALTGRAVGVLLLAACVTPLASERLGLALPWMPWLQARGSWVMPPQLAGQVGRLLIWLPGALAVVVPAAMIAGLGGDQRHGLARLHVIVLFWAAAVATLTRRALHALGETQDPVVQSPVLWMALGAAAAGMAADSWSIGLSSLSRALASGAAGVAGALALGAIGGDKWHAAAWVGWAVPASLFATGLLVGLVVPTAARIGLLAGHAHMLWLLACAGLTSVAVWHYLKAAPLASPALLAGVGVLLAAISCAAASEVRILRNPVAAALQWLRREWQGRQWAEVADIPDRAAEGYPFWLHSLRAFTYLGYAPWWALFGLVRGAWLGVTALWQMVVQILGGVIDGLLGLLFRGARAERLGRRVVLADGTPVVTLTTTDELQVAAGPPSAAPAPRPAVLSGILILPTLTLAAIAARINRVYARFLAWLQRRAQAAEKKRAAAAVLQAGIETVVLAEPTEATVARPQDAVTARQVALRRRSADSRWRQWMRAFTGGLLGARVREWLAPDIAEPWEDAVFRAEVMTPGQGRFQLWGHLWRSRRRRGCVVTIPVSRAHIEKAVEVGTHHRLVRNLLREDAEQVKKMLLRAAYRTAVSDLLAGRMTSRTIICDSPREDLIAPHQDRLCELREEMPGGGYRCRRPMQQDRTRGATTLAACARCNFPEIFQRCSSLQLEGTIGIVGENGVLRRSAHMVCAVSGTVADIEQCLSKPCFSPCTITEITAVDYGRTR